MIRLKGSLITWHFFIHDLTNQLIEELNWFYLDELIGAIVARVGQNDPEEQADETVIYAELELGKEEQGDDHDPANGQAVQQELP